MAGSVSVSVIGVTNSGKSTFVNCLVERKVLPQSVRSETSVLTHVNLRSAQKEPFLSVRGEVLATGHVEVHDKIKSLSGEMRGRSAEDQAMTDVAVFCAPREALRDIGDGSIRMIDIPGYDEAGNPIVKAMLRWATSLSDVVMVNVPYEAIGNDTTKELLDTLETEASHVMKPRMLKRVEVPNDVRLVFIISKCDKAVEAAVADSNDDEPEEEIAAGTIAALKADFRALLDRQWGESFPHAAKAPVFAVSASNMLAKRKKGPKEDFDWPQVEDFLRTIHAQSSLLRFDRKLQQASRVIILMHQKITTCTEYPMRAKRAIAQGEADLAAQEAARVQAEDMKKVLCASIGLVGIGLCMAGGWWAVGSYYAYSTATAAAAAATSEASAAAASAAGSWFWSTAAAFTAKAAASTAAAAASSAAAGSAVTAAISGTAVSIGGVAVVVGASVGAVGASKADAEIVFDATYESIKNLEKYQDTLIVGPEVVYVGDFVGKKPHGRGRAFWSNEVKSESIIGEFEDGRFRKGMVFDERAAVIGVFVQDDTEGLLLDGWQPDGQIKEDPICVICFERSALYTENRCFDHCLHGTCCEDCAMEILRGSAICPLCQQGVTKIIEFV